MTTVVVERSFRHPLTDEQLQATGRRAGPCFELHGVAYLETFLAADRLRMCCVFDAPDAESVRIANRQSGAGFDVAWSTTLHAPERAVDVPPDTVPVLVERVFDTPVDLATLAAREAAGQGCLDEHGVRWLRTYHALDRQRMLCVYAAPDAESVRSVQRTLAMPVTRVWSAILRGTVAGFA